jgi:hypothetical protein
MKPPDFFIVGALKAGTTSMADYLGQHPQIFMPKVKDVNFFGSDMEFSHTFQRSPDWFRPSREVYLSFFEDAGSQRVGEASAAYLCSTMAAREIKEFCPAADIIIMLRNPADMIYSLFNHWRFNLNEDIADFGEALAAEEERRRGERIPSDAFWPGGLLYREVGRLADQVGRFFEVFDRSNLHIIVFDDFKNDTAAAYRETLRFLGVDEGFEADLGISNPSMRARSPALQKFFINPPRPLQPALHQLVKHQGLRRQISRFVQMLNRTSRVRAELDPGLRRELQAEFAPQVERLSRLVDRDLTHWIDE